MNTEKKIFRFNKEVIIPDKLYNVQHLNLECCFADNLRILVV